MKSKLLIFFLLITNICLADVTYTTSVGATFTQVQSESFGVAWKDPSGMIWSRDFGLFSNKPQSSILTGEINDSDAAKVCLDKGGKLPSLKDLIRLGSYFEWSSPHGVITEIGHKDLFMLFPSVQHNAFWSSTINGDGTIFYLFYKNGAINCWMKECSEAKSAVHCVEQ